MSIAAVVTRGYGSFGSAALVMTRGFTVGEIAAITAPGLEFTMPESRMHYEMPENKIHFTMPVIRTHFTMPDEDS